MSAITITKYCSLRNYEENIMKNSCYISVLKSVPKRVTFPKYKRVIIPSFVWLWSVYLTLRKDHNLEVLQNNVYRRIWASEGRSKTSNFNEGFQDIDKPSTPPLWSSGQSSWLQTRTAGFDSRRYQIFREVVGLESGPFSLQFNWRVTWKKKWRFRSRKSRIRL
jgi:hypothetical protein